MLLALAWYWSVLDNNTELAGWARPDPGGQRGCGPARPRVRASRAGDGGLSEPRQASSGSSWEADPHPAGAGELRSWQRRPDPPFAGLEVLRCMVAAFAGREDVAEQMLDRALASPDALAARRPAGRAWPTSTRTPASSSGCAHRLRAAPTRSSSRSAIAGVCRRPWSPDRQLATMDGRLDDAVGDLTAARSHIREMGSADDDIYLHSSARRPADPARGLRRSSGGDLDACRTWQGAGLDSERVLFGKASLVMIEWHGGRRVRARELAEQARVELTGRDASAAMMGHLRGVTLAATGLVAALDGDSSRRRPTCGRPTRRRSRRTTTRSSPASELRSQAGSQLGTCSPRQLWPSARPRSSAAVTTPTDRTVVTLGELLEGRLGSSFAGYYAAGRTLDRVEAQQRLDPERYP